MKEEEFLGTLSLVLERAKKAGDNGAEWYLIFKALGFLKEYALTKACNSSPSSYKPEPIKFTEDKREEYIPPVLEPHGKVKPAKLLSWVDVTVKPLDFDTMPEHTLLLIKRNGRGEDLARFKCRGSGASSGLVWVDIYVPSKKYWKRSEMVLISAVLGYAHGDKRRKAALKNIARPCLEPWV